MTGWRVLAIVASFLLLPVALVPPPAHAAADDMNLTGLVLLTGGTPLGNTQWANNTSFAIYVNHDNDWSGAWRYPPWPQWYTTSMGAYSIVLPASEKDRNWSNGDSYRVQVDAGSIVGAPGLLLNATSNGTGDPGEFTPPGSQNNSIVWSILDNWQKWDVVVADVDLVPNSVAFAGTEFAGPYAPGATLGPVTVQAGGTYAVSANVSNLGFTGAAIPTTVSIYDSSVSVSLGLFTVPSVPPRSTRPAGWRFNATWTAPPAAGDRYLDIAVDRYANVTESRKDNNVVRIVARVIVPGLPDYVPFDPLPPSPIHMGLGMTVRLSARVRNQGAVNPSTWITVSFYNETTPSSPFISSTVPPLGAGETSAAYNADWVAPSSPQSVTVAVAVDSLSDLSESDESNNTYVWNIDVTIGPITSLVIGNPNYTSPASVTYVKSSTPIDFSVVDQSGLGIRNTTYRTDGGDWVNYTATGQFVLAGEGQHTLEWYSEDYAGNVENASFANLTVDDTPPATTISPTTAQVESGTYFTIGATDSGSGVNYTEYMVDGGTWARYAASFTLSEGDHNITYRSVDNLGNLENEKYLNVTVSSPYVPPAIEANYKPLIALVFAIILAVVGLWYSKKKPWKNGTGRMAVLKVFTIVSAPFVLVEAATGVISLITGQLSIPPLLEIGTAVDLAILLTGIAITVIRARKPRTDRAGEMETSGNR